MRERQRLADAVDEPVPPALRDRVALLDRSRPALVADEPAGALGVVADLDAQPGARDLRPRVRLVPVDPGAAVLDRRSRSTAAVHVRPPSRSRASSSSTEPAAQRGLARGGDAGEAAADDDHVVHHATSSGSHRPPRAGARRHRPRPRRPAPTSTGLSSISSSDSSTRTSPTRSASRAAAASRPAPRPAPPVEQRRAAQRAQRPLDPRRRRPAAARSPRRRAPRSRSRRARSRAPARPRRRARRRSARPRAPPSARRGHGRRRSAASAVSRRVRGPHLGLASRARARPRRAPTCAGSPGELSFSAIAPPSSRQRGHGVVLIANQPALDRRDAGGAQQLLGVVLGQPLRRRTARGRWRRAPAAISRSRARIARRPRERRGAAQARCAVRRRRGCPPGRTPRPRRRRAARAASSETIVAAGLTRRAGDDPLADGVPRFLGRAGQIRGLVVEDEHLVDRGVRAERPARARAARAVSPQIIAV